MIIEKDIITTTEPVTFVCLGLTIKDEPTLFSTIWYHSHVRADAQIGENVMIGEHCYIDKDAIIGDNCRIQNGVSVYAGNILEEDVFLGPNCTLLNDVNPRVGYSKQGKYITTTIKKGATIGGGAVILPGITIEEYAFVGAGAVVTKDVFRNMIVVGNPAESIGYICKCGKHRWLFKEVAKNNKKPILECDQCKTKWNLGTGEITNE